MTQAGHGEAVLLLAHGGPASLDDLARFLADVRGSAPSPQGLSAARERYAAIGGRSPMPAAAMRIAGMLAEASSRDVAVGFHHSSPVIETAVADLAAHAPARVTALCMAPHFSHVGPGSYLRRCREAAAAAGLADRLVEIPDWHLAEGLLSYWTQAVRTAVDDAVSSHASAAAPAVVFTAHSIPLDREPANSPYREQVAATAAAIAGRCGLSDRQWRVAFQSAVPGRGSWLGPSLDGELADRAHEVDEVIVAPIGFTCEQVETLYDLDVVTKRQAADLGLQLRRPPVPNDAPQLVRTLADVIEAKLRG